MLTSHLPAYFILLEKKPDGSASLKTLSVTSIPCRGACLEPGCCKPVLTIPHSKPPHPTPPSVTSNSLPSLFNIRGLLDPIVSDRLSSSHRHPLLRSLPYYPCPQDVGIGKAMKQVPPLWTLHCSSSHQVDSGQRGSLKCDVV